MKKSLLTIALATGVFGLNVVVAGESSNLLTSKKASSLSDQQRQQRSQLSTHSRLESARTANHLTSTAVKLKNYEDGQLSMSIRSQEKKSRASSLDKASSPVLRSRSPLLSKNAFGFSFYSATSSLNQDLDSDGYYSDFSLSFDADFDGGSADVYAVIYYSRNNSDWTELAETEVFNIYSDDASDEYTLSTTLNFGFPTGNYDILIDLYEYGISGIVATISSDEVDALYALPLEDREHEVVTNYSQISFVATDLFGDGDNDAFYTDLTIEYDIDAQYSGDMVYAEIILTNTGEGWQQRVTSSDFELTNSTEFVDLTFNTGYPPGYYDVKINLINVFTGEVVADAGREFSSLVSLPIESINYDDFYDEFAADVDLRVSGGGSMGWVMFFIAGLVAYRRRELILANR
jgi:hypothetical protein